MSRKRHRVEEAGRDERVDEPAEGAEEGEEGGEDGVEEGLGRHPVRQRRVQHCEADCAGLR